MMDFQPTLARAIHKLDTLHHEIRHAERETIHQKATLRSDHFTKQMRLFSQLRDLANKTATLGRAIGDAFAWIFYSGNHELIKKHLKHEKVTHMPIGTGGRGEIAFIENVKIFNGIFVLFHGNTTILRLGDISLIDMETFKIIAIGDLKSQKGDGPDLIQVSVHLVSTTPLTPVATPAETVPPAQQKQDPLPEKMLRGLKRQLIAISDSFMHKEPEASLKLQTEHTLISLFQLSQKLESETVAFQRCGDGLILMGLNLPMQSFWQRMKTSVLGRGNWDFGDLESEARTIIDTEQPIDDNWNSVIFNRLEFGHALGSMPLLLFPIAMSFLRKLFFQESMVVTIYNPAFLVRKLQRAGFSIERKGVISPLCNLRGDSHQFSAGRVGSLV